MSLLRRPSASPTAIRRLGLVAGLVVLASLLPVASAGAASPRGGAGLQPTIQYEEAQAHADDRIAFTPGGRVTVPFRPRATDRWKVGGGAPRALPAGRLSGKAMRAGDAAALDRPVADPDLAPTAVAASWDALSAMPPTSTWRPRSIPAPCAARSSASFRTGS